MAESNGSPLIFELKDIFSQYLWRQADSPNQKIQRERPLPDGSYLVEVLYSLSRSLGSSSEAAAALARDLHDALLSELEAIEPVLAQYQATFAAELARDILQLPEQFTPRTVEIPAEKLRKLPLKFVRCIIAFDGAMHLLTEKYRRAIINRKEFTTTRDEMARPLRRFMAENNKVVKSYHVTRRDLIGANTPIGADLLPLDQEEQKLA